MIRSKMTQVPEDNVLSWYYCWLLFLLLLFSLLLIILMALILFHLKGKIQFIRIENIWELQLKEVFIIVNMWKLYDKIESRTLVIFKMAYLWHAEIAKPAPPTQRPRLSLPQLFLILADVHPQVILHHKLPTHSWDYTIFFIHKLSKSMKTPKSLSKDGGKSFCLLLAEEINFLAINIFNMYF